MEIMIYRSLKDAESIWKAIEEKDNNYIFSSYEWIDKWYRAVGKQKIREIAIVYIFKDNQQLIIPLCILKNRFIRILDWLGNDHVTDYNGIVQNCSNNFLKDVLSNWDLIEEKLPKHDIFILRKQPQYIGLNENPFFKFAKNLYYEESYQIRLNGSFDEIYSTKVSKKLRYDIRRQSRRLNKLGELRFIIPDTEDEKKCYLDELIKNKIEKLRKIGGKIILQDKAYRNFYYSLLKSKKTIISVLLLDNKILASQLGCVYKNRYYYLMPSYSMEWSKYSVGKILLKN